MTARVITGAPVKEGWRHEPMLLGGSRVETLVAPDGARYVAAKRGDRAALIVDLTARGLGRRRLRLLPKRR